MVTSLVSVPMFTRVHRSIVCSCSVCGVPCRSNQNLSLKPTVSMTSVSLSNHPIEWPNQVGIELGGMLAAVHEDLPVAVDVPLVEDEHVRRLLVRVVLHEAERIWRRSRHAHRHAPQVRIVRFALRAVVHQRLRRRQQRQRFALLQPLRDRVHRTAANPEPVSRSIVPSGSRGAGPVGTGARLTLPGRAR